MNSILFSSHQPTGMLLAKMAGGKHVTLSNGEPAEDKKDTDQEEKVQMKPNITVLIASVSR